MAATRPFFNNVAATRPFFNNMAATRPSFSNRDHDTAVAAMP
jgi:hypothetical protein